MPQLHHNNFTEQNNTNITSLSGGERDGIDLPLYEFVTLRSATNNFSKENKLGEGGFGPVYKVKFYPMQCKH